MKLIKDFYCDNSRPTLNELNEGMEIAKKQHCIVRLFWNVEYSGTYSVIIEEESTLDDINARIPKVYPR